jgi:hypothetical protein
MIVTKNLKHFPPESLAKLDLEALGPDEFLSLQIDIDQPTFVAAVKKVRSRLKNPPLSSQEYLDSLVAQGLPRTAEVLTEWIDLI